MSLKPSTQNAKRRILTWIVVVVSIAVGLTFFLVTRTLLPRNERARDASLPEYAYNSAPTLAAYRAARELPELLSYMPCYCGCGPSEGHTSLRDCFLLPDGSFNRHAAGCHICVEETADAVRLYKDGKPFKEIRTYVDQHWSEYGKGTNTPPVS